MCHKAEAIRLSKRVSMSEAAAFTLASLQDFKVVGLRSRMAGSKLSENVKNGNTLAGTPPESANTKNCNVTARQC